MIAQRSKNEPRQALRILQSCRRVAVSTGSATITPSHLKTACRLDQIDELGLKGTRVGAAVVSDRHGNFVVNEGGATAEDVLNLIEIVRQRAKAMRGIELETEVEIIGVEKS